jgi:hypothetical protein
MKRKDFFKYLLSKKTYLYIHHFFVFVLATAFLTGDYFGDFFLFFSPSDGFFFIGDEFFFFSGDSAFFYMAFFFIGEAAFFFYTDVGFFLIGVVDFLGETFFFSRVAPFFVADDLLLSFLGGPPDLIVGVGFFATFLSVFFTIYF